jgi:formate hydrogenlyase transcriptional activator
MAAITWAAVSPAVNRSTSFEIEYPTPAPAAFDSIERRGHGSPHIIGNSASLRRLLEMARLVAPTDATVLINGETGTGKELIAETIHRSSDRADGPFVKVNCAAIPASLLESELFGHERGAFTGAIAQRIGRFESASRGTVFLDEIGEIPLELQPKLLRVLQEREFERLGSSRTLKTNTRVVAATNRDLEAMVKEQKFRADLFYRLNVFPLRVSSLRERAEDIAVLAEHFVAHYARKVGKNIRHIGRHTMELFKAYHWPGNVRELQNLVERGVILTDTDTLFFDANWLERDPVGAGVRPRDWRSAMAEREVEMIEAALAECRGRVSGPFGAAAKLGMPRTTLESKIRTLGINKYGLDAKSPDGVAPSQV